jgi:hypothetical protein
MTQKYGGAPCQDGNVDAIPPAAAGAHLQAPDPASNPAGGVPIAGQQAALAQGALFGSRDAAGRSFAIPPTVRVRFLRPIPPRRGDTLRGISSRQRGGSLHRAPGARCEANRRPKPGKMDRPLALARRQAVPASSGGRIRRPSPSPPSCLRRAVVDQLDTIRSPRLRCVRDQPPTVPPRAARAPPARPTEVTFFTHVSLCLVPTQDRRTADLSSNLEHGPCAP